MEDNKALSLLPHGLGTRLQTFATASSMKVWVIGFCEPFLEKGIRGDTELKLLWVLCIQNL